MPLTVQAAEANLADLLRAAEAGEEIVIAKDDRLVAKLVPIRRNGFKFGLLEGKGLGPGPDFFEPMPEDELRLWEGRGDERD